MENAKKWQARKNEQGFTLIELLIVIVILGILAAIVVFSLGGVVSQSSVSACQSDVSTVENAIQYYVTENNGNLPADQAALTTPQTATNGSYITYLNSWPSTTSGRYSVAYASPTLTVTVNGTTTRTVTYGAGGQVISTSGGGSTPLELCNGIQ